MASESSKNGSGGISFLATINNAKVNPFFIPANKLTYFFINWLGFLSTPYFQATKPWVWITKPGFYDRSVAKRLLPVEISIDVYII